MKKDEKNKKLLFFYFDFHFFFYLERQETKRFVLVPFWPSLFLFCLSGCCFRYSRFGNKFLFFFFWWVWSHCVLCIQRIYERMAWTRLRAVKYVSRDGNSCVCVWVFSRLNYDIDTFVCRRGISLLIFILLRCDAIHHPPLFYIHS